MEHHQYGHILSSISEKISKTERKYALFISVLDRGCLPFAVVLQTPRRGFKYWVIDVGGLFWSVLLNANADVTRALLLVLGDIYLRLVRPLKAVCPCAP